MLSYSDQDEFRALVKGELARRRMTITQLAKEIGRSRPVTQLAITRGLHEGTQRLIDEYFKLGFFKQVARG
mgnify:CR=1 FL=1